MPRSEGALVRPLGSAYYLRGDDNAFKRKPQASRLTTYLNWVAPGTFGAGAALTFVFVLTNL